MTATFNEAVQSGTITFTLVNSAGTSCRRASPTTAPTYTVTLTPSSALAYNTKYTATVSGAKDSAGDPMSAAFSWSFTTDAAAPTVTSESPASGATNVAVSTAVTATFNEAIQSGTITFTLVNSSRHFRAGERRLQQLKQHSHVDPQLGLGLQHQVHGHGQRGQG